MSKAYYLRNQKTIVPVLNEKDVYVGELLGQGAFSDIREVKKVEEVHTTIYKRSSKACMDNSQPQSDFSRYAIKKVREDLKSKNRSYAYKDLLNEAAFLSVLDHPNIIQIHGIGEAHNESHSFLLLERISCTLEIERQHWKKLAKGMKRQIMNKKDKAALWNERLDVAIDFASAMAYLHNFNMLHRDLKLGNCGFDASGQFKLFDFGMATILTQEKRIASNQYELSGLTGTCRYMAPEVFRCKPYGRPSDVYSFSLILWEIMSLKDVFIDETKASILANVHGKKNKRPAIKSNWPPMFQQLLTEGWSADSCKRPSFVQIQPMLQQCQL